VFTDIILPKETTHRLDSRFKAFIVMCAQLQCRYVNGNLRSQAPPTVTVTLYLSHSIDSTVCTQCTTIPHPTNLHEEPTIRKGKPPPSPQDQTENHGRPSLLLRCSETVECPPKPAEDTTDGGYFKKRPENASF